MRRRIGIFVGVILFLVIAFLWLLPTEKQPTYAVTFSDGKTFHIEKISYGTNHDVGKSSSALFYLRKIPNAGALANKLDSGRGESRLTTQQPALVIWYYARDGADTNYINSQVMDGTFIDDHGDAYRPFTTSHHNFGNFNRRAIVFYAFPRWQEKLKLQVSCYDPDKAPEYKVIEIRNPVPKAKPAQWESENLPVRHLVGSLELCLDKLILRTNLDRSDMPILWWDPELKPTEDGGPLQKWDEIEWEAMDPAENRGKQLGVHQPILKYTFSLWPKPELVAKEANHWRLSSLKLETNQPVAAVNLSHTLGSVSLHFYGIFGPGQYSFCEGEVTNSPPAVSISPGWFGTGKEIAPGKWKDTHTHYTTNYTCYIRQEGLKQGQRIGVILRDEQGRIFHSRPDACPLPRNSVQAWVFEGLPGELKKVIPEIILIEPLQTEFVVKPPVESLK